MIIICTNTGHIRAFRVTQSDTTLDDHDLISEISDKKTEVLGRRVGERLTDQAGRFPSDGSPGMSNGEANGSDLEEEKRLIGQVADEVAQVVEREKPKFWKLAAPKAINSRLVAELAPAIRESMIINEKYDFTKLPTLEVGRRFGVGVTG